MSKLNFSDYFKRDAVHQITERGYLVHEVSERLGVSTHSLYQRKKQFGLLTKNGEREQTDEICRLKRELAFEGMTMICVTHEMGLARNVVDQIIFMADGHIVIAAHSHAPSRQHQPAPTIQ